MREARRIGGVGWSGVSACGVKIYKPNNYYKQIKLEFIINAKQQVVNILYTRFLLFFLGNYLVVLTANLTHSH